MKFDVVPFEFRWERAFGESRPDLLLISYFVFDQACWDVMRRCVVVHSIVVVRVVHRLRVSRNGGRW